MATKEVSVHEIFGNVISSYSRQQAIEDGVLVDLMQDEMTEVCRQHYKYPIACTSAVFSIMQKAVENKRWCNDYAGVLHDMLYMSRKKYRELDSTSRVFVVIIRGAGQKIFHTFKMVCGPDDDGSPCMTIMLTSED